MPVHHHAPHPSGSATLRHDGWATRPCPEERIPYLVAGPNWCVMAVSAMRRIAPEKNTADTAVAHGRARHPAPLQRQIRGCTLSRRFAAGRLALTVMIGYPIRFPAEMWPAGMRADDITGRHHDILRGSVPRPVQRQSQPG